MKSWLPVLVLALLAGCATAPKAPVALGHHPVLIVLDLQQDYFGPEAKMPVASGPDCRRPGDLQGPGEGL
jgi:hypothetical protein